MDDFCVIRLQRLLNDLGDKTAMVFVNTKKSADSLARQLDKSGYRVTTLHGGKTQDQREVELLTFTFFFFSFSFDTCNGNLLLLLVTCYYVADKP